MKTEIRNTEGTKSVPQFQFVETGIYRKTANGVYYERPKVNGKRTWRSLETANLKYAREVFHSRRSGMVEREAQQAKKPKVTVGEIIRRYVQDGYPDRQKQVRQGRTLECETYNSKVLLKYWDKQTVDSISLQQLDRYHEWRKRNIRCGKGDRAVDMELNTLSNAMLWGMRCNLIQQHPLSFRRPRYCCAKSVKHCRDFMPHDSEAMHDIGKLLFADIRSETLGWQFVFEAFTGLRTCEALQLRTDAKPYEAGWISPDGKSVCVRRAKNQQSVNPLVRVHEGLAAWLKAHRDWKQNRYPNSPWYFPSYRNPDTAHSDGGALGQALRRLEKTIGRKITSHGMRAFYVTVRRSHGIPDIQIAWEIGHTSAGKTLASVYGGVPPHWLMDDGPKLQWLPTDGQPAWEFKESCYMIQPVFQVWRRYQCRSLTSIDGFFNAVSGDKRNMLFKIRYGRLGRHRMKLHGQKEFRLFNRLQFSGQPMTGTNPAPMFYGIIPNCFSTTQCNRRTCGRCSRYCGTTSCRPRHSRWSRCGRSRRRSC